MKNLILTIATGFTILTSCSVDQPIESIQTSNSETIYLVDQQGDVISWDILSTKEYQNISNNADSYSGALQVNTDGKYVPDSKYGMQISWTGTSNPQGIYGNAIIIKENSNSTVEIQLVTECIIADGNEVVYGGIINKMDGILDNMSDIGEGWRFYFKIIDSKQDDSLKYDLMSNHTIFASPMSQSLCNVYTPDHEVWSIKGYTDVKAPNFIEVSN